MDETCLIYSARQGDLEAFNCLVLAYQDLVFQHALWMLGEPDLAEAVTQEIFLLAYRELRSFQGEDIRIWLLRIADRLCLEEIRRREQGRTSPREVGSNGGVKVEATFQVTGLACSPEGNPGQNVLEKIVREGLKELSLDLRAVITLVDLQGMDYPQTAEILGISGGSVKRRLARARMRLRDTLFAPSRL